jgi:serine phosphatase RsbU (regulator of sigma subunit)
MSLRFRLIVAFFFLSVVPLAALTLFTYASNARAMREAAGREAELLAGELSQRMQVVTAQLSERVERLMDVAEARAEATAAESARTAALATTGTVEPAVPVAPAQETQVAQALGEMAMLLENVELRGLRGPRPPGPPGAPGGGRGRFGLSEGNRGGRPDLPPPPAAAPTPPTAPTPPVPGAQPAPAPNATAAAAPAPATDKPTTRRFGGPRPSPGDTSQARGSSTSGTTDSAEADSTSRGTPPPPGVVPPPGVGPSTLFPPFSDRRLPPGAGASPDPNAAPRDRIMIDVGPMRRDIVRQFVPEGQWEKLSEEERQRIMAEVNQRMMGIAQGIQLGAAEAQKRVAEAQRAADAKAQAAAAAAVKSAVKSAPRKAPVVAAAPVVSARATPARRKMALSGTRLDVTFERDGKVVRAANAEVNLPNLLATVLTTTRRDRGEIPFAVGKDGRLYTQTDDDKKQIEAIGGGITKADEPAGTTRVGEWIVVSTADPTGSGLRFGIARPVGDSLLALRRTSARNAAFGLGFIGLALIGIVPLSSRLTRNLSTLSDGVRRIAHGDYSARVKVGANDEVGRLARAFNQMAEDVELHQRSAVEQERIKRELELGRQIQHDMLPQGPLRFGLTEIKGVSVPAKEVGGDFFNYFSLTDGRIALLVGDVSGKGVGAALLMANIQASLRTRLALGQDLDAIAREIDVDIEGNTPGPIYATLFVGMLNPATRELRYVNAGHNPQYILRTTGTLERMSSSGLPVGLLAGRGYAEARVQLAAGDLLFFYTDGCVEAENEAGEMFGAEKLEALLVSAAGAEDLLARVETVLAEYRGTREPFDDATMMVVKVG